MFQRKKNKASLKRRITRTFSMLNMFSLLILLTVVAIAVGMSFRVFTQMLSSSVAERMAEALSFYIGMDYKSLGDPYLISEDMADKTANKRTAVSSEGEISLIYYRIFQKGSIAYDSLNKTETERQAYNKLKDRIFMKYINVRSTHDFTDENDNKVGTIEVEMNPILVYIAYWVLLILTVVGFMLVHILTQLAVRIFTPMVIKPIADLENKMSTMANGDIESALKTTISFTKPLLEVEQLSNHANKILSQMKSYLENIEEQNQVVETQRDAIQAIFQQVDQGILRIDEHFVIQEAHSKESERLLGSEVSNRQLAPFFYPDSKGEQQFFNELLKNVFQAKGLEEEVYISLLPDQLELGGRFIHIGYKPMKNTNEQPFLMVILTDLTEKRDLERQMALEQKALKMVVKSMIHTEELKQVLSAFYEFIEQAEDLKIGGEMDYLLREVHTFKGNFSQYDWLNLVDFLDELEDAIIHKQATWEEGLSKEALLDVLDKDLAFIREHVGKDFLKDSSQCVVERDKILRVESRIKEFLSKEEAKEILHLVREMRYQSIFLMLDHYRDYVQKLSERLGKSVHPLVIQGDDVRLDPDYFSDVFRNFVHLFRNSIDHGIESPEERAAANKPLEATLALAVRALPEQIEICLEDDGAGIDYEVLEAKARALKIFPEGTCAIEQDLLKDIIFMDGVTSIEQATKVSGKGVGLSALKAAVDALGGQITVASEMGRGTSFTILLPRPLESQDLTTPREFMVGLSEVMDDLFNHQYAVPMALMREAEDNQVVLDEMTAIVNLKGTLNLIVMMSINRKLLHTLVPKLVFYEIEEAEYGEVEEDLLGELANTVIGNSLRNFNHSEDIFHLGIPVIMSHSEGYIKYSQDLIISRYFEREGLKLSLHLIPIHSEYIIKRLREV